MEFLDNEALDSQDEVLVPSSQRVATPSQSIRPAKRRRLNTFSSSEDGSGSEQDDYDLPSNEAEDDSEEEQEQSKSKYEDLLHVPTHVIPEKDHFVTQVEQPWSSPGAIRGPRWRKKSPTPPSDPPSPRPPAQSRPRYAIEPVPQVISKPRSFVVDEFDDDDAEILEAMMVNEDVDEMTLRPTADAPRPQVRSMRQTTLFGMDTTQRNLPKGTQARTHNWPMANRDEPPTHHKIDREAMKTWVYPLNVGTIRDYQFNIVSRALYHNILVALPTGLGKTFIAATVMLNYFNWTTDAQLVFVAPTKPLVTQQVEACFNIAGIPRSQTTLLTGEVQPAIRAEEWQEKRVFFMTPQTLINDLKTGMADPKRIVLLVVDEAHKATGNYAYVEVVRFLRRFNSSFRVLALTATPGASVEAVQKVIDGLDIARVEIRTEESMDIRTFVHSRNTELQVFDNTEEIEMCLDLFAKAVQPVLNKVVSLNASFSKDPKMITLYGLMKGREQWTKSEAGRNANWGLKSMVNACFKPLMSLAHNLELLKYHGIGPFYHKMRTFDEEAQEGGKYTKMIMETESYRTLMTRLRGWINTEDFVGHPKLNYLNEVVLNHFMDAGSGIGFAAGRPPSDTRIMIFAHYRDSAEEIVRVLNRHKPMIRAHVFVGQSSTKGSEGMDQKTQIDIIKKFKAGTYNTLVATSIGEEGLDIGEVDLIVCYDCSKSPIRMLQRMGRTGRKRAGNIVLLLMRGKEERDYYTAKDNYLKMQEIIEKGTEFAYHDDKSQRIVPKDIQPVVDKRRVEIPIENTQAGIPQPQKRKAKNPKRPPKRFNMPDGVETGFSFLGNKSKSKSKGSRRVRTPTPEPEVDLDIAELPSLQSVILTTRQEEELDQRYAQVAGSDTIFIEAVRFDRHPQELRQLQKVQSVKHSNYTESLVQASKISRKQKNWERPNESDIMTSFSIDPTIETESTTSNPRKRHTANQTTSSELHAPSNNTADPPPNSHSSNEQDHFTNHESPNNVRTNHPDSAIPPIDEFTPFYTPRHFSQTQNSELEDDLLDITTLISSKKAPMKPVVVRTVKTKVQRRGKRIVVSDDDE